MKYFKDKEKVIEMKVREAESLIYQMNKKDCGHFTYCFHISCSVDMFVYFTLFHHSFMPLDHIESYITLNWLHNYWLPIRNAEVKKFKFI